MVDHTVLQRRRWRLFGALALMYILVYFYRVSLAVVAADISRDLRLSPQQLGALAGILFYVYAAAQIPLGPMIDRLGGRLVISASGLLTATGGILFSQADTLPAAMAARVLIGIGTASVLMGTFTIFSHWYSKQEFGRISGFMVAVGNLGNLAGTAPLALAVAAVGWRSSFLAIGVVQVLVTVLVYTIVRDRPPSSPGAAPSHPAPSPPGGVKEGLFSAWGEILGNRDFWLLGGVAFFWYGNYLALQGLWGGPYLMEVLGLSRSAAGRTLMFTSLGFISGSMMIDTVARTVFRSLKKTLLAGQLLLLIPMSSFLGPAESLPQPLLGVLFFATGMAVSSGVMVYPIIRAMFRIEIVGTALTSLNFFVLMGAAVTQQAMGLIIGSYGRIGATAPPQAFHAAFLFPVTGLAAAILLFRRARDYS
ncbi:MFS transporter [Geobacter sp. SVR]|uniref:MFS transporter n=1 Tax=Geobacter sp. SVR TaxID=2495594 RepID=UPI00143EFAA4|nr:MFS transporter [Geobacter sp. SVR]BCS52202.1 MFS transporter [Geobacter sp. SVR]GCF85136.1 MFS transporter [Geobacter sp. SVR]